MWKYPSDLNVVVTHFRSVLAKKYNKLDRLEGALGEKNGYEEEFCKLFRFERISDPKTKRTRYGDAYFNSPTGRRIKIELKKTKASAFWLDAVRYSETIRARQGKLDDKVKAWHAREDSLTIFIQLKPWGIEKILCLDSLELIRFIDLNDEEVEHQLRFFARHNESVNSQLSITISSLEQGVRGYLILFEEEKIKFEYLTGSKIHQDFPKARMKNPENETATLLELIETCGKETFSAKNLHDVRGDICTYGEARIRKLLREVTETDDEEKYGFKLGSKNGRYYLA